jgi:hypothetical protein
VVDQVSLINVTVSQPQADGHRIVYLDNAPIGRLTRPKFAPKSSPGFFLTMDNITWNNAPGARFTADSGGGNPSTYVRSVQAAILKAVMAIEAERAAKRQYPRGTK